MGLPPTRRNVTGFWAYGAHISRDETYWDETVAASSISPPTKPPDAATSTGRLCYFSRYLMSTPFERSESTRGPIGLSFIRRLPVRIVYVTEEGLQSAATVVRNRDAVPAFPRYNSVGLAYRLPPFPLINNTSPSSSHE